MSRNSSTMITPSRERGQHLKFEDRVSIKIYRKLKYTLRAIADVLDECYWDNNTFAIDSTRILCDIFVLH